MLCVELIDHGRGRTVGAKSIPDGHWPGIDVSVQKLLQRSCSPKSTICGIAIWVVKTCYRLENSFLIGSNVCEEFRFNLPITEKQVLSLV